MRCHIHEIPHATSHRAKAKLLRFAVSVWAFHICAILFFESAPTFGHLQTAHRRPVFRVSRLQCQCTSSNEDEVAFADSILEEITPLFGRREDFQRFAENLLPRASEWPIADFQAKIEYYARRGWKDCKVFLQGSAARNVHNKHHSDLDFAIQTPGGIELEEFKDFCDCLKYDREVEMVSDSMEFEKAIKLKIGGVKVDVACLDRLGDASRHGPELVKELENFYKAYPGAERAVRVAKYVFFPLKGLDVEYIAVSVANQTKAFENRNTDLQGLMLFHEIVYEMNKYPDCGRWSPLQELIKKARSQHGKGAVEYMERALKRAQVLAEAILFLRGQGKDALNRASPEWARREYFLIHFELLTDKSSSKQGDARDAPKSRKDARLEKTTIEDVETAQCSEGNKRSEQVGIEQLSTGTSNLRRSNQADQTGDGPPKFPTMRVLEIFDDMLYCLEQFPPSQTQLEEKVMQGWCMAVDAMLEMVTEKSKEQRWKERKMPSGIHEVREKMLDLGLDFADLMNEVIRCQQTLPTWMQVPLLAFLSWWKVNAEAGQGRT